MLNIYKNIKRKAKKRIQKLLNNLVFQAFNQKIKNDISFFIEIQTKMESATLIIEKGKMARKYNSRFELYNYIINENLIQGDFLEFGVWEGESIRYFEKNINNKVQKFYGFDSFEGLPENWRTGFSKGEFDLIGEKPFDTENIKFVKGWFNESIPNFLKEVNLNLPLFIHIDCDLYSSTRDVFKYLDKYINIDTYILFDELIAYPGWKYHEYKALNEFVQNKGWDFEIIGFNNSHEQVLIHICKKEF